MAGPEKKPIYHTLYIILTHIIDHLDIIARLTVLRPGARVRFPHAVLVRNTVNTWQSWV